MNVQKTAFQLETAAEKMGYSVRMKFAQTGTIYLTCSAEVETGNVVEWIDRFGGFNQVPETKSVERVIRVADHQDAYGRADYTCDEIEGTYKGAKAYLKKQIALAVDVK